VRALLSSELSAEDFPEEAFLELLEVVRETYRRRFDGKLKEPLPFSRRDVEQSLANIRAEEKAIEDTWLALSRLKEERRKIEQVFQKMIDDEGAPGEKGLKS